MNRRVGLAAVAGVAVAAAAAAYLFLMPHQHRHAHPEPSVLEQTLLPVAPGEPLRLPALTGTDGAVFAPERLQGRWSVVFFGFTSCPDVCPMTLQVLSKVARDAASGVADGTTQIVFVSVDPERDSVERMKAYLASFDPRIIGLTGSREAIERFSVGMGAGYTASATGIDHSTSLFIVDPKGRLAAVMLRPADAARIVSDLARTRAPRHVSLDR